jgi:hypothetical protein
MSIITKNLKLRNTFIVISIGFALFFYFVNPEPKFGTYISISFVILIIGYVVYELSVRLMEINQLKKGMNYKQSLKELIKTYSYYLAIITLVWLIIFFIKR